MSWKLTSVAFPEGGDIPKQYTCDGADISPALSWTKPPDGTKSLVLVVDDPDAPAGTWVHWVVYNIPTEAQLLTENVPKEDKLTNGALQGVNDFGRVGYGGPCPPRGSPHRYFFKLFALKAAINLPSRVRKSQLETAMEGLVIGKTQLIGLYKR